MRFYSYFFILLFKFIIFNRDVTFCIKTLLSKDFLGLSGVSLSAFACKTILLLLIINFFICVSLNGSSLV